MANEARSLLEQLRTYLARLDGTQADRFLGAIDWEMDQRSLEPNSLACLRHLGRAGEAAGPAERPLVAALSGAATRLRWGQTYTADDLGDEFLDNYGWMELCGIRGHFASDRIAAGFLLLGPGITYPDHHHVAEELYVPLTDGALWRKGESGFVEREAGEVIHHPSSMNHAMRTGERPLLAIYLWRGGPLAARSTLACANAKGA